MNKIIKKIPSFDLIDEWLNDGVKLSLKEGRDLYWVSHSVLVAKLSKKIAKYMNLDEDFAYKIGLLHDIGKQFHPSQPRLLHAWYGYKFLIEKGYPDVARYCLTHAFTLKEDLKKDKDFECLNDDNATQYIRNYISNIEYDSYDELVQLSDAVSATYQYFSLQSKIEEKKQKYSMELVNSLMPVFEKYEILKQSFETRMGKSLNFIYPQNWR